MKIEDAIREVKTRPTVPLWPHLGLIFELSKSGVYGAAKSGQFEVIRIGRSVRAITAPLRKQLKMDVE
jgi:hypothetical protein